MNKQILHILLALIVGTLAACTSTTLPSSEVELPESGGERVLRVDLAPSASTRAIVKDPNSKGVLFRWNVGAFDLNIAFKQGNTLRIVRGVEILKAKGEACTFEVTIPKAIDPEQAFDLYGVVADDVKVKGGKLLVNVGGKLLYQLDRHSNNSDGMAPVYFKAEQVKYDQENISAEFEHLGSMAVVQIKNKSTKPLAIAGFAVRPTDKQSEFYHKAALPFEGNTELPYLNLLDLTEQPQMHRTAVTYPAMSIPAGATEYVGFWFRANTTSTPEVSLVAYETSERKEIISTNSRPKRATAMQAGRAYNLYAEWDGTELKLVDAFLPEYSTELPTIKMTLNELPTDGIPLAIAVHDPVDQKQVWIDLNGNGTFDLGEAVTDFQKDIQKDPMISYKVTSTTFTIYGHVDELSVMGVLEQVGEKKFKRLQWLTGMEFSQEHPLSNLYGWFGIVIPQIDFSPLTKLQTLQWYNCEAEQITLPQARNMGTLGIEDNPKLTSLDLSGVPNLQLLFLGNNGLTSITAPSQFTQLMIVNMTQNKLEKEAIEGFVTHLNQGGQKFYSWMYSLNVAGNPGAATVDAAKVKAKGWTLVR